MATKSRVKPSPRPVATVAAGLVKVDNLKVVPRRVRSSRFDPIAKELFEANDPKVAKIYAVPEGRDLAKHRSQVYVAMHRSLLKIAPKGKFVVTVRVLEGRQFGISVKIL